jgi:transcriptional regulator CtsR
MDDGIEQLIPAVDQQISSPETPYVEQTYRRLIEEPDIDEHEAKLMIALCLADESEAMIENERDFDIIRYRELLTLLPILPG